MLSLENIRFSNSLYCGYYFQTIVISLYFHFNCCFCYTCVTWSTYPENHYQYYICNRDGTGTTKDKCF